MKDGWDAVAVKQDAHHKAELWYWLRVCARGRYQGGVEKWCVSTWKANPDHVHDLIGWARWEQSTATVSSLGTATSTKTMRNALDELFWEQARAVFLDGGTANCIVTFWPDISYTIRRANQDIVKPKVRSEASCSVFAGCAGAQPGHFRVSTWQRIWWSKLMWIGWSRQWRSKVLVIEYIRVWVSWGKFWWSTGYSHREHIQRVLSWCDEAAETDSTNAYGSYQRRGVARLRNLWKREWWSQGQVEAKNVEKGRVSSDDIEADLGTDYLERDRITKCTTKMGMVFAGAGLENSCRGFRSLKCSLRIRTY